MSGTVAAPEGITNPPIDELLAATDSKYSLVIYAAKRARQINAYYSQLGEGLLEYVGPLVETHVHEKPLSIALREINEGLLTSEPALRRWLGEEGKELVLPEPGPPRLSPRGPRGRHPGAARDALAPATGGGFAPSGRSGVSAVASSFGAGGCCSAASACSSSAVNPALSTAATRSRPMDASAR